jgi:phage shock protein E
VSVRRLVIDVREPIEYESGHLEGALNIPPAELLSGTTKLDSVEKDIEIIVYCRSGSRSNASIQILHQMGFTNLVNGINAGHVAKNYL